MIPADILTSAQEAVTQISARMEESPTLGAAATEIIAEALMARDERAAKIAEEEAENCRRLMDRLTGGVVLEALSNARIMADAIAAAIREREQP